MENERINQVRPSTHHHHNLELSCDLETGADESTLFTFQSDNNNKKKKKKLRSFLIKSSNNDEEERMKYLEDDDRVGYNDFEDDETLLLTDDDSSKLLIPSTTNNKNKTQSYGGVSSDDVITGVISLTAKPNGLGRRRFLHGRTPSNNHHTNSIVTTTLKGNSKTKSTSNSTIREATNGGNNIYHNNIANTTTTANTTTSATHSGMNNTSAQLLIHNTRKRRWQYMCFAASFMGLCISLLISITIVIFYVFRSPYVYIDQLSITKLPTSAINPLLTDGPHAILGFNLNFLIYNMNIQEALLTDICIEKISIKDIAAQTSYDLISNSIDWQNNGTNLVLKSVGQTSYTLPILIDFTQQALSPAVIKTISDLLFSSLQSNHSVKWIIKGTAKVKVGNLIYRVIDLTRNQQYFSST